MEKSEWIERCAKRYVERSDADQKSALEMAEEAYDIEIESAVPPRYQLPLPEDAADEDMSCWDNDERDDCGRDGLGERDAMP